MHQFYFPDISVQLIHSATTTRRSPHSPSRYAERVQPENNSQKKGIISKVKGAFWSDETEDLLGVADAARTDLSVLLRDVFQRKAGARQSQRLWHEDLAADLWAWSSGCW